MKCVEIGKNIGGESVLLGCIWHSGTKARGAKGIRYPCSPSRKRWILGVACIDPSRAEANALSIPPGEYARKCELKGIDGGPHKRWSMWFNSMQREEPYQDLTCREPWRKLGVPSGARTQVVHGCRQLVS